MGEPMNRSNQGKLLVVLAVTAAALWLLSPSYQFYSMTPAQREATAPAKLAEMRKKAIHLGLDLQGGLQLLLEVDTQGLKPTEARDAVDRAREIINNRIDQFGVAEPLIQIEGDDRITVQLPGLTDRVRMPDHLPGVGEDMRSLRLEERGIGVPSGRNRGSAGQIASGWIIRQVHKGKS